MGKFWSKQQAREVNRVKLNQFQNNLKQELWKEEMQSKQFQVFEMGQYFKGQRIGKWICFQNNKQIAGGFYDDKGKKKGKWSELSNINQNVIYRGEYNMNNMKVGIWDITFDCFEVGQFKQIYIQNLQLYSGGGSYDQEGNQKKIGKWVELDEEFNYEKQVTYNGEYNMNNMKVGRWDIMFCRCGEQKYQYIGGGLYDYEGNQNKVGKWVELFEGFYYKAQVTYNGEYNMSNKKVGRWDVMYCRLYQDEQYKQIGGGSYDQEGNQKKIGKWVELDEEFNYEKQVTYNGEYNMNNMKVGRWDIMFCLGQGYMKIGGGSYDAEGNQQKIGKWVELDQKFSDKYQVTFNGQYNMNNMKVGRWDIFLLGGYKIGGGSYDQEGNQKKIGKWVEFGEYNMNNMKVGRWDIMYDSDGYGKYKKIGGGSYDQKGNQKKIGKWVEIDEEFRESKQVTLNGEYNQKGQKVGIWYKGELKKRRKQIYY